MSYTLTVVTSTGVPKTFSSQSVSLNGALNEVEEVFGPTPTAVVTSIEEEPSDIDLMSFGYTIHDDPDQEGYWYFTNHLGEGSDISYPSPRDARSAALDELLVVYRVGGFGTFTPTATAAM